MTKRWIIVVALLVLCLLLGTTSCEYLEEIESQMDTDGDGWTDAQEEIAGTDPNKVDTDDDGYWDPHDSNPLDPDISTSDLLPEPPTSPAITPTPTPAISAGANVTSPVNPEQAALEELRDVQAAVKFMMRNNKLTSLANLVTVPTNDMHLFPDISTRHGVVGMGYVLNCHDFDGDGKPDTNYILIGKTKGTYICDKYGNVTQVSTGYN